MTKPRALDLFCGAGGAGMGLHLAGYEVTGVDIRPQPRYPFRFVQDDAMAWLRGEREPIATYDLIWASPPCQFYSELVPLAYREMHPNLLPDVLPLLRALPIPYICENVSGARRFFQSPIVLCGSMFGLPIQRHRWFEVSPEPFFLLPPCNHSEPPVLVSGRGMRKVDGKRRHENTKSEKAVAMGIDWMLVEELEEAIPPAYSRFLAERVLEAVQVMR